MSTNPNPNRRHACPKCLTWHAPPKPSAVLRAFARGILFAAVEVIAACSLSGWLSVALWGVAAWNVFVLTFLIVGLAGMASKVMKEQDS